ncbi:MAG: DUF1579 domain-containing protein [Planctomycetes bacterium]|nr:DUF1579 domain-containing protein [Planctomycetota bacterium]
MLKKLYLSCCIAALSASSAMTQPDTSAKDVPFGGAAPPEELKVLAPLVGQWTTKSEGRPSLQSKAGFTATGEMTGQWLHNRHFIRLEGKFAGARYREEATVLYSYDAKKKAYRRWLFTSAGLATESLGQWDAEKLTMTWKPLDLPPNVSASVVDVIAKDRFTTTLQIKRDDGQVLRDVTVVAKRKK